MSVLKRHKSGFTLLELLVVIAIVGMIASIILVSLNNARRKARNTATNSQLEELIKAIELSRSQDEHYPITGNTLQYCLGHAPNGLYCYAAAQYLENNALNTALARYIPTLPNPNQKTLQYGALSVQGSTYACNNISCSQITIRWFLEGPNERCPFGGTGATSGMTTECTLVK